MKKERKKMKKWVIILIASVSLVTILVGAGVLWLFWGSIFNKAQNSDLGAYYGYFGYAPDTMGKSRYFDYSERISQYKPEIEAGMKEDATDEEKILAAYIIYRIASLADATAMQKAKYTVGSGDASGSILFSSSDTEPISVSGLMNLTATYYTLKWPFTPLSTIENVYDGSTYETYEVSEEYTQIPSGGVSSSQDSLVAIGEGILPMILTFARKNLVTPSLEVTYNGDSTSSVITPEGVTAKFKDRKGDYIVKTKEEAEIEKTFERKYPEDWGDPYGLSAKDFSIHVINLNTIIASSVQIERKLGTTINGLNMYYYSVKFDVDTFLNRGTEECASYYAEKMYIYHAPKAFTDYLSNYQLFYSKLCVEMTVFENGYMRTWGTDEVWDMSGGIELLGNIITAGISSQNKSVEAFCYDYDTIMQGFSNRYFGDAPYVNVKSESLPFYSLLKNYPPQEYGTYR